MTIYTHAPLVLLPAAPAPRMTGGPGRLLYPQNRIQGAHTGEAAGEAGACLRFFKEQRDFSRKQRCYPVTLSNCFGWDSTCPKRCAKEST